MSESNPAKARTLRIRAAEVKAPGGGGAILFLDARSEKAWNGSDRKGLAHPGAVEPQGTEKNLSSAVQELFQIGA